ncbi:MAG: AAA family ATPase, partial [Gammaproteobacteria bacterium]
LSESVDASQADETLDERIDHLAAELTRLEAGLDAIRQDDPLVPEQVDSRTVAAVIAGWTGIPIGKMLADEAYAVRTLGQRLGQRVMGQDSALGTIAQRIQAYRAGLTDPAKPVGVFLLVGPTGVGKTETAYALADALYGGERNLISINLSEYQEAHTVSQLKGAPPGYVGYGTGGVLTEAVRRRPYSVVLLDEVEKAHPEVLNLFYQAFDKGELADGEGRLIDCKNVVFFLTSNLGYQVIVDHAEQPETIDAALYPELSQFFKPALLARMEVVPYLPLGDETLNRIIGDKLERLAAQIRERYQTEVILEQGLVEAIRSRAHRSENGARMLESIIEGELLPPVSLALLEKLAAKEPVGIVTLSVQESRFTGTVV